MFDIAIRNGKVIDGTGNPWFRADVGIIGEKIVSIGKIEAGQAQREIDATGLMVCPGLFLFILVEAAGIEPAFSFSTYGN